jgi:hypothetical protein
MAGFATPAGKCLRRRKEGERQQEKTMIEKIKFNQGDRMRLSGCGRFSNCVGPRPPRQKQQQPQTTRL